MLSFQNIVVYIFKMPAMKLAFQESSILFKNAVKTQHIIRDVVEIMLWWKLLSEKNDLLLMDTLNKLVKVWKVFQEFIF